VALRTAVARFDDDADLAGAALTMARRFASGATMWCLAPQWPEHGRHVAVEFVHPVIMGKRALPSVSVEGTDAVTALRTNARAGDIVLAVASASEPTVCDVMQRCPAWGVTSVWVGAGPRPPGRSADHLLWSAEASDLGRHDGSMVFAYHVLWELVHVCFEHPGLLREPEDECDLDGTCITCTDEARLGEVASIVAPSLAAVRTARGVEEIDTTLVDVLDEGALVLIHGGVAIARVDPVALEAGP
jgi:hydrogenase maturation factor